MKYSSKQIAAQRAILIGKEIRQIRIANDMTQEQLARLIKKSVPTVSKIESGKQALDVGLLWEIGEALRVSPAALMLKVQRDQAHNDPIQTRMLDVLTNLANAIEGPDAAKVTW